MARKCICTVVRVEYDALRVLAALVHAMGAQSTRCDSTCYLFVLAGERLPTSPAQRDVAVLRFLVGGLPTGVCLGVNVGLTGSAHEYTEGVQRRVHQHW
jgi:hypothetical protein